MILNFLLKSTLCLTCILLLGCAQEQTVSSASYAASSEPAGIAPWPLNTDADTDLSKIDPASKKEEQKKINRNNQTQAKSGWSGASDYIDPTNGSMTQPVNDGRVAPSNTNFPLANKKLGSGFGQQLFASSNPPGYPIGDNDEDVTNVSDKKLPLASISEDDKKQFEENKIKDWIVKSGSNLRETLDNWASQEGWNLVWKTSREYPIQASVVFTGRFMEVSAALIRSFTKASPSPQAKFYGNKVIVVTTFEGENAD
jgi:hypothetical protein